MIGKKIAHYSVTEMLGKGGMGVVYRATDTKLGREVALKVLPPVFANDAARMARFKREAHVLASLNHPNIASIYGLEEADGVHCLLLELVEGPTLAEKIKEGAIPLEESLTIAKQISDALEAAHEKGVIHRDLKPANVKVTPEGMVKALDFGLAKALAEPASEDVTENSPTASILPTQEGVILGTAAYMSPEQAKGKVVDKRADIWAFGVVLFEMLTGKRLYTGENASETLASVIKDDSDWNLLPTDTPLKIRELLRRCLQKDSRKRLRDIGDARIEIEEALADPSGTLALPAGGIVTLATWRHVLPWAATGVLAIIAALALWPEKGPETPQRVSARFTITLPEEAPLAAVSSMRAGAERPALALSPDGRRLVYIAQVEGQTQLYLRDMITGETSPILHTERGHTPFFSPDGNWIGYFADGKLKKLALTGEEPFELADAPNPWGGVWAPDDTIYFNTTEGEGIFKVPVAGGVVQAVTQRGIYKWPEILPNGETLLISGVSIDALNGGLIKEILTTNARNVYIRYAPTGYLLYALRGELLVAPFSLSQLESTGVSVKLLEDLRTGMFNSAQFAFSEDGTFVYAPGRDVETRSLAWVDREGNVEFLEFPRESLGTFELSPDGKQIAISKTDGRNSDIWIYDLERTSRTRLSVEGDRTGRRFDGTPRWTPDGRHIVYMSAVFSSAEDTNPTPALFWKPADGSRKAVPIHCRFPSIDESSGLPFLFPDSFSPDGSILAAYSRSPRTGHDLWLVHLGNNDPYDEKPVDCEIFLQSPYGEAFARFSPDGHWIAYMSDETGQNEVYPRPFPEPGRKILISTNGGSEAHWNPNESV